MWTLSLPTRSTFGIAGKFCSVHPWFHVQLAVAQSTPGAPTTQNTYLVHSSHRQHPSASYDHEEMAPLRAARDCATPSPKGDQDDDGKGFAANKGIGAQVEDAHPSLPWLAPRRGQTSGRRLSDRVRFATPLVDRAFVHKCNGVRASPFHQGLLLHRFREWRMYRSPR